MGWGACHCLQSPPTSRKDRTRDGTPALLDRHLGSNQPSARRAAADPGGHQEGQSGGPLVHVDAASTWEADREPGQRMRVHEDRDPHRWAHGPQQGEGVRQPGLVSPSVTEGRTIVALGAGGDRWARCGLEGGGTQPGGSARGGEGGGAWPPHVVMQSSL